MAKSQGKTTVPGTTMFLAQAARQFEIWTKQSAPREAYAANPQ
jgi:shikimate 5-dehydrogenase